MCPIRENVEGSAISKLPQGIIIVVYYIYQRVVPLSLVPPSLGWQCGKGFCRQDVVVLNGTEEEVKRQREGMEKRRLEAKQAKQAAKVS